MAIVFFYAVLGGMKGITYTQAAQYCVLIFAYLVPAIFISILLTDHLVPQIGFGGSLGGEIGSKIAGGQSVTLMEKLNQLNTDLGFAEYTSGKKSMLDVLCITGALMAGTAGLPHVIVRFYTVPKVRDARLSAGWALLFIAILYTTAPAVAAFARTNLIETVSGASYAHVEGEKSIPQWFKTWEDTGLLAWVDKNGDGKVQYVAGDALSGSPVFDKASDGSPARGAHGERLVSNANPETKNELYVDRDIIVLANPEIANLPAWVVALVAAGGLAAALSTAAGLLLVVSTSVSHDLLKRVFVPSITEQQELLAARVAAGVAVLIAGYFGINPPGFVAQVVAFAFGLACSSFFPAIILGVFVKRANREGVISGMLVGITFTAAYIIYFKFMGGTPDQFWFGISPEGIGALGMVLNFLVAFVVSRFTPPPPQEVQDMVEHIRVPVGAKAPSSTH
jgi:cation/acetate symporter